MGADGHRGIIKDLDAPDDPFIFFDFFEPPQRAGASAEWEETGIPRRSEAHQTWVQTSSENFTLSGSLFASIEQGDDRTGMDVEVDLRFLESLQYPSYTEGDGLVKPPHRVSIWISGLFYRVGFIKDFVVNYKHAYDINGLPMEVGVTFTFVTVNDTPLSAEQVRAGIANTAGFVGPVEG